MNGTDIQKLLTAHAEIIAACQQHIADLTTAAEDAEKHTIIAVERRDETEQKLREERELRRKTLLRITNRDDTIHDLKNAVADRDNLIRTVEDDLREILNGNPDHAYTIQAIRMIHATLERALKGTDR